MISDTTPLSSGQLEALADLRTFLQSCWNWAHMVYYDRGFKRSEPKPTVASTFMCRHTSSVLLELLGPIDPSWRLNGGTMLTNNGQDPQPHWWIENEHWIVDLTADQFGWPTAVTVASRDDARYVRQPGATNRRWISGLKTTLDQWKGEASRPWMSHDPLFQAIAQGHEKARAGFQEAWQQASLPAPPSPKRVSSFRR